MRSNPKPALELWFMRQVFPTWRISVPSEFDVTVDRDDNYWHAWDARRSVSLTSIMLTDSRHGGRPVPAADLLGAIGPIPGEPVEPPPGLTGWGVVIDVPQPARATRAITGFVAVEGRLLLATITSDDVVWATSVWRSIGYAPASGPTDEWELRPYRTEPAPARGTLH